MLFICYPGAKALGRYVALSRSVPWSAGLGGIFWRVRGVGNLWPLRQGLFFQALLLDLCCEADCQILAVDKDHRAEVIESKVRDKVLHRLYPITPDVEAQRRATCGSSGWSAGLADTAETSGKFSGCRMDATDKSTSSSGQYR